MDMFLFARQRKKNFQGLPVPRQDPLKPRQGRDPRTSVKEQKYMMQTNEQSTIVAVFVGREQANQAIDNLRHAGFSYDQIRLVEQGANSFTESLKSLFTGRTTTTTDSA